jgi:CubicO group peptidase (beta-lactamase class C family)
VSKSIQSLLVGIAIRDRVLGGLRQPITDRVPELRPRGFDQVTLEHLLQMTSGSSYLESDNPLGEHPALYYGTHMTPALLDQSLEEPPGTRWEYKSGDSQLLGLALSRALAPETITDFARRVLWEPLGMEHDGSWAVDHPGGLEKTFCCLAMTAIDLAKIGAMVAAGGAWRGRQLVPRDWIRTSTTPTTAAGGADFYRLGWWVPKELDGGFMGSGHLGQFLFIFPESKVVIVRLGTAASPTTLLQYIMVARQIERALRRSARGRIH